MAAAAAFALEISVEDIVDDSFASGGSIIPPWLNICHFFFSSLGDDNSSIVGQDPNSDFSSFVCLFVL